MSYLVGQLGQSDGRKKKTSVSAITTRHSLKTTTVLDFLAFVPLDCSHGGRPFFPKTKFRFHLTQIIRELSQKFV